MKVIKILFLLFLSIAVTGCTTKLNVTYHSDPPGASLYQGKLLFGYCPTTLIYNVTPQDRRNGYVSLRGPQVKWVSGATAKIELLRANLATDKYQQFTFKRPDGVDGFETDAKFGLEVQKIRLMQQQDQAQQDANLLQIYNAISIQQKKSSALKLKTNCSSRVIGNTIYTDCYYQ